MLEDALRTAATEGWDEEVFDAEGELIRRTRRRDPRLNRDLLERRKPKQAAESGPVTIIVHSAFPGIGPRDVIEVEAVELAALEQGAAS